MMTPQEMEDTLPDKPSELLRVGDQTREGAVSGLPGRRSHGAQAGALEMIGLSEVPIEDSAVSVDPGWLRLVHGARTSTTNKLLALDKFRAGLVKRGVRLLRLRQVNLVPDRWPVGYYHEGPQRFKDDLWSMARRLDLAGL